MRLALAVSILALGAVAAAAEESHSWSGAYVGVNGGLEKSRNAPKGIPALPFSTTAPPQGQATPPSSRADEAATTGRYNPETRSFEPRRP
jgi:hypothetical protein